MIRWPWQRRRHEVPSRDDSGPAGIYIGDLAPSEVAVIDLETCEVISKGPMDMTYVVSPTQAAQEMREAMDPSVGGQRWAGHVLVSPLRLESWYRTMCWAADLDAEHRDASDPELGVCKNVSSEWVEDVMQKLPRGEGD